MRRRTIILVTVLSAAILPLEAAHAQLSPQGILGGLTRPLRQALGHFAHFPRTHRHRTASADSRAAAATSPTEPPSVAASRLGFAGAPAWPSAYEDVLGFALWPDDYAARLRGRGFDVIADTISGRGDSPRVSARTATTGAAITDTPNSMNRCSEAASGSQETWPSARVEQILQLSDAQHDTLEKLQAAVTQSTNNIRADCQPAGIMPPERLRALVQTLWAVRDAGISVRGPVKGFYDTLTSTQKNSFASNQPQINPPPGPNAGDSGMNRQYQACAAQNAEKAERLIKEIEMRVRPNKDQAASFENLHKISADMAKLLIMPCAQPTPADPTARLDAAAEQLTALNYAATAVQMAFDDFYAKLNNEQKARFESLAR
jgi:LTXXQ motif family protein